MPTIDVLAFIHEHAVESIDLRWADFDGRVQQFSLPAARMTPDWLARGEAIPHSSPPVKLRPIAETAHLDPFAHLSTLVLYGHRVDAEGRHLPDDARAIALRAIEAMRASGVAESATAEAWLEFFVFDQAFFDQGVNFARHEVDSREASWRRGRLDPENLGTQLPARHGGAPLPPFDSHYNLRAEMVAVLKQHGVCVAGHEHGPATAGQMRIRLSACDLVEAGDRVLLAKHVVRNVAARHGKVATFMPQPLFGESGCGMNLRIALQRGTQSVFAGGATRAALRDAALRGLRARLATVAAFTNPTVNSYRRLAGMQRSFESLSSASELHASTAPSVTVPEYIELPFPDASGNPHAALAAVLLALVDGIRQPAAPDASHVPAGGAARAFPDLPASLDAALRALEADCTFLTDGGVFSPPLLAAWIRRKREREISAFDVRPHPYEFCLYFDV